MYGDLTDAQWAQLEPLLPSPPSSARGGRPRHRSRRELIDGVRWRFRTGTRWDRLPARYGPHQTAYALFHAWRRDGTWERLIRELGADSNSGDQAIIPWVTIARSR